MREREFEGLGLRFSMDPELGGCLMHSHGRCAFLFRFNF
jgi:hypothetical protein